MEAERATYFNMSPQVASDKSDLWLGWKKAGMSLQSLSEMCTGQQGIELGMVTRGFKFIQFGRKILTSSKIKDYSVTLVACLLSSDPRLWGTLEDTER